MQEVIIDSTTGLPELAGGHYWKVYEDPDADPYRLLNHRVGIFTTGKEITVTNAAFPWQKPTTTEREFEVEVNSRIIYMRKHLGDSTTKEEAAAALAKLVEAGEVGWEIGFNDSWYAEDFHFLYNNRLDEANILRVAVDIVKEEQSKVRKALAKAEEQARIKKLVGTYPPKKLEV